MAARTASSSSAENTLFTKFSAVLAWSLGVWTTYQVIIVITNDASWGFPVALFLQAVFTKAESPIWKGKGEWYNYVILCIDTVFNVGGLFIHITRLDQTASWQAFAQGLGLSGSMSDFSALVVSLFVGILVAATPEFLWKQG